MIKHMEKAHMYLTSKTLKSNTDIDYTLAYFSEPTFTELETTIRGKLANEKNSDVYGQKEETIHLKRPTVLYKPVFVLDGVIDYEDSDICYMLLTLDKELTIAVEVHANELEKEFEFYNSLEDIIGLKIIICYDTLVKEIKYKLENKFDKVKEKKNELVSYGILEEGSIYKNNLEMYYIYLGEVFKPLNFKIKLDSNEIKHITKVGKNLFLPLGEDKEVILNLPEFKSTVQFLNYYKENIEKFLSNENLKMYKDIIEKDKNDYNLTVILYTLLENSINETDLRFIKSGIIQTKLKNLDIQNYVYKKIATKAIKTLKDNYIKNYENNKARFNLTDVKNSLNNISTSDNLAVFLNLYENSFTSTTDYKPVKTSYNKFLMYILKIMNS